MLPPICASLPACPRMCAIRAVVVDLPLVPVMATNGASGALLARSRANSSMSPMISTPAARAFCTVQCGSGCVSGTPGASTSAANRLQSAAERSSTGIPASSAACRPAALSSAATTRGTAGHQGAAARHSGHPEAEDRNSSSGEGGDRCHRGTLARVVEPGRTGTDGCITAVCRARGGKSRERTWTSPAIVWSQPRSRPRDPLPDRS